MATKTMGGMKREYKHYYTGGVKGGDTVARLDRHSLLTGSSTSFLSLIPVDFLQEGQIVDDDSEYSNNKR